MKKLLTLLLLIIIIGCTSEPMDTNTQIEEPKEDIAQPQTPEPEVKEPIQPEIPNEPIVQSEPIEVITQPETIEPKEESTTEIELNNLVEITINHGDGNRGVIEPSEVTIKSGQKVRWTNINVRDYLIQCKFDFKQVFKSDKLKPEDYSEYTFEEPGTYECVEAIFGARSKVIVE